MQCLSVSKIQENSVTINERRGHEFKWGAGIDIGEVFMWGKDRENVIIISKKRSNRNILKKHSI